MVRSTQLPSLHETSSRPFNTIACYLAPPTTIVFLLGVFCKCGTRQAAWMTLIAGSPLGVVSFLVDLLVFGTEKVITEGWGRHLVSMTQAWGMFCFSERVVVVVNLPTPRLHPEKVSASTWKSPVVLPVSTAGTRGGVIRGPGLRAAR